MDVFGSRGLSEIFKPRQSSATGTTKTWYTPKAAATVYNAESCYTPAQRDVCVCVHTHMQTFPYIPIAGELGLVQPLAAEPVPEDRRRAVSVKVRGCAGGSCLST